jgi:hypothetical protein
LARKRYSARFPRDQLRRLKRALRRKSSSDTTYRGLRTVCQSCASSIDFWNMVKIGSGIGVALGIAAILAFSR